MHSGLRRFSLVILLALLALVSLPSALPAAAQDTIPAGSISADEVNAVARQLYCPVCENIPLDVCGTAACAQWRDEIRIQLEEGRTPQQVIDDFVLRFGERVVGTPQDPLLRALSLVTPWLVAAVAVLVAVVLLSRWTKGRRPERVAAAPAGPQAPIPQDDYRARLETDLEKRR
jgi:cytochrome c-type biogenesis protein CcmH